MKTVCIDSRMLHSSGIGTFLKNILLFFKDSPSFSIRLLVTKEQALKDTFLAKFDLIPVSCPIYSLKEQVEVPFKVPHSDIFWSPHFNVPIGPVRAKKRITTIHDVFHLAYAKSFKLHKRFWAKVLIERACKLSDLVITDSIFSQSEIQKYTSIQNGKIRVVPLGVDQDRFCSTVNPSMHQALQKKYNLPEKFILFVGNIKPHKNLKTLIEAYKNWLRVKGKEYHLVIIGKTYPDYPLVDEVKTVKELQRQVHFFHDILDEELPVFYQTARVTVLPSFYEGFGLPPLEAMASGCPTIVSASASLPEICNDSSVYIDPHNPMTIYEALQNCLENNLLRLELQKKGFENVQLFSWKAAAEKYIELFEKLV
jgi:glycosyltransferase involved in cell wall biosynthesis